MFCFAEKSGHRFKKAITAMAVCLIANLVGANELQEQSIAGIQRGAYLARIGNCMGCHTAPGGQAMAGGRRIDTRFGTFFSSNLTPDKDAGIGRWTAQDFYHALHEGVGQNGRLLYPVFPYPEFTRMRREDSDAIYAYLMTLPTSAVKPEPHNLRFPYDSPMALRVWRWMFFKPSAQVAGGSGERGLERGAYLSEVVAHCISCHSPRNALGALRPQQYWQGGFMPSGGWYAPGLNLPGKHSVQKWPESDIVAYLQTGRSNHAVALGPMAEVIFEGAQYLTDQDARAIAQYLKILPPASHADDVGSAEGSRETNGQALGKRLYERHCAECHGAQGQGRPGQIMVLANNAAIGSAQPDNLIQMVLYGGYAAATCSDPFPYGMPPFFQQLRDEEIAAVLSYVRSSWGHRAAPVSAGDVYQARERSVAR